MTFFRPIVSVLTVVCFSALLITFNSCSKNDSPSKTNEILTFTLQDSTGWNYEPDMSLSIRGDSVLISLPVGTDLTWLKPIITFKGDSLFPASGVVQDFSKPLTYTITAKGANTKKYVVAVSPVPLKNRVYVGTNNNKFLSLDAITGKMRWEFTGSKAFGYSNPAYKDGVVYVGGVDNYVYAFNATTGKVLWKFLTGTTGIEAPVTIDGNTVYVGCNDDVFYALDAKTGIEKWRHSTWFNISTGAVIADGIVYFGCSDSKVYALNAADGTLKWSYYAGDMINASGPAVTGGFVYVGSRDKYLHAINATTGDAAWKYYCGVSMEMSSPTVVNGVVYIGGWYDVYTYNGKKGSVYAINAATGALVWEKLNNTGFGSSPVVSNGILYISADGGNFYALNASTGATVWSKQIYSNSDDPTVANGRVFIGDNSGLYALDAATGAEKWKYTILNSYGFSGPLVLDADGKINHASSSGMVQ